jgi:putative addiction module CopG family antidote
MIGLRSTRMTVKLIPELERFIAEKVRNGEYASPQEAVNSLLAGLKEQEALTPEDVAELRVALDPAIAEADRGEFTEFTAEDVIAEARSARSGRRKGA